LVRPLHIEWHRVDRTEFKAWRNIARGSPFLGHAQRTNRQWWQNL